MRRRVGRGLAVVGISLVGLGAFSGLAGASSGFQLSVSPTRIAPGGKVTVSTTPRMSCSVTLTIAGKKFSHGMRYGWMQITMPRKDLPGRVPVKVDCGGHIAYSAFTVAK